MSKKIFLVLFTAFFLSGCTLLPKTENAATDVAPDTSLITKPGAPLVGSPLPSASLLPSDVNEVTSYEKSQTTSTGNDVGSLEKDLNSTVIPDDNLNDVLVK